MDPAFFPSPLGERPRDVAFHRAFADPEQLGRSRLIAGTLVERFEDAFATMISLHAALI